MSLKQLPRIEAIAPAKICAFEQDVRTLDRWNANVITNDASDNTISVLDVIGSDYISGEGVTAKRIAAALRSIGNKDVIVNINSPGGDFFEGVAIYNLLREHPAKVTVQVLGLAASAASIIAMAGDEILIAKSAFLMIHNVLVVAMGNRLDFADAIATMEPFDDALAGVYADRSGKSKAEIVKLMDAETWFNGEDAIKTGLADGILSSSKVKEDKTKASANNAINATRRVDTLLAQNGLSRSERRSLIASMKHGTHDATVNGTHDAAAETEITAGLVRLLETIQS